jgi:hypothetical protein
VAWWNVITRSIRNTRVSKIILATCTNFGLSCFWHPDNSCQKSPNHSWQDPVKVLYILNHLRCLHISDVWTCPGQSPSWCPIKPCQKSLANHKPMIYDLTAVASCRSFLWLFRTYFVWLSIGSDCRDSSRCKTSDIVKITLESNCYREVQNTDLPPVLAASIRCARILFHLTPILRQSAAEVISEILSNFINHRGTYSSMYRLVMTSIVVRTAVCTRVSAN